MVQDPDSKTRKWLAIGIVALSIVGIAAIAGLAIGLAGGKDRPRTTQLVFSSVLPLFGTWVGTVLAFYFARENLKAATESTLALRGAAQDESAKLVNDVMIRAVDWVAFDLQQGQDPRTVAIEDLRGAMRRISPPSRRLPIRDANGAVRYVVHDSTLNAFEEFARAQSPPLPTQTFGNLLDVPEFKGYVEAIGFVSDKATVADARKEIDAIKNCNDVFVTQTGQREDRAVGWLTNTQLAGIA